MQLTDAEESKINCVKNVWSFFLFSVVHQFPQDSANSFTQQQFLQQPPRVRSNQTSSEGKFHKCVI